jgi:hypothetical protein
MIHSLALRACMQTHSLEFVQIHFQVQQDIIRFRQRMLHFFLTGL